jgi:16S rRNA processing protein RimM
MSEARADSSRFTVGEIVAAHGLHGEVRCALHTDFPERFQPGLRLWVAPRGKEPWQTTVRTARWHETKSLLILSLDGVRGRDQAVALAGAMLEIDEQDAMPLPEGVYYEHQIIGLRVVSTDGRDLGVVREILHTGANDVYETPVCLIPAIADVVQKIDIERGHIVVKIIPGLLAEDDAP